MSVQINVVDSNNGITELLKGIVNWLETVDGKQRFVLILDLHVKTRKKDC